MKKVIILIAMITLPLLTMGQNATSDNVKELDVNTIVNTTNETSAEATVVLSATSKASVNNLSYKKSNELISVKAYRKSLQIKVKEIKMC